MVQGQPALAAIRRSSGRLDGELTPNGQEVDVMPEPGVVVGFDGSAASARALEWAVCEANIRGVPLTVCHAWEVPLSVHDITPATTEPTRRAAKRTLARGIEVAGRHASGVPVRGRLLTGPAAPALAYASENAELLVAGTRGAGGSAWLGLGSVSSQLTTHARCPVEVVRGDGSWRGGGIVVGVDGSSSSQNAAGFAFEEAALRGVPVTALCSCWEPSVPEHALQRALDIGEMRRAATQRAELVIEQWREKFPEVSVTPVFVMDAPREALQAAAQSAGLLVVGSRGLGGIPGLLLGSVSQAVLEQAPCPVAVIRAD
jgi:nucleotide-binding universal stress UspA family protein